MTQLYRCLPCYNCRCESGKLVSLATARRHRDRALIRMRADMANVHEDLPLPMPVIGLPEDAPGDEDWDCHTGNGNYLDERASLNENSNLVVDELEEVGHGTGHMPKPFSQNVPSVQRAQGRSIATACESSGFYTSRNENSIVTPYQVETSSEESILLPEHENNGNASPRILHSAEDIEEIFEIVGKYGWCIGFFLRHDVTLQAMDDLINHLDHGDGVVWKTVLSRLRELSGIHTTSFQYCSLGHEAFTEESGKGREHRCSHKDCQVKPAPIREMKYIALRERLQVMMQCSELGPDLICYVCDSYHRQYSEKCTDLEDFYSGILFKKYAATLEDFYVSQETPGESRAVHLFLFLSTDGAPAYKSSLGSFWPVILFVGNIPPDRRYHAPNILPVMCIPGNPKDLESFLKPLYDELEELGKGFMCTLWDGRDVKVVTHLIYIMADLQAVRNICKLKGVNGYCPCRFCNITGILFRESNTVYYPDHIKQTSSKGTFKKTIWKPNRLPSRTPKEIRDTFEKLRLLRQRKMKKELAEAMKNTGIIDEPSFVKRFNSITPYLSVPVDLMHLLFENVAPLIMEIWTGKIDTNGEHAYLGDKYMQRKFDSAILKVGEGIPDTVRRPRGLKEMGLWKADEWRTFVITTSMATLPQFLPQPIMQGWWLFHQICDFAMRPWLKEVDVEVLSRLTVSFYNHFSSTYYKGRNDRIHLMKYVLHLILHIPDSIANCGPLVCLSQFPTERYIGVVRNATNAKYKFAESVTERWIAEQSARTCSRVIDIPIPWLQETSEVHPLDKRSKYSNMGRYEGFWLRGPFKACNLRDLSRELNCRVDALLARFYQADLGISRKDAESLVKENETVGVWDRLYVKRPAEFVLRKYGRFIPWKHTRSCANFAAEFGRGLDEENVIDVYYGSAVVFLEHGFHHSNSGIRSTRILVVAKWANRGLHIGTQKQIFAIGKCNSQAVFTTATVEDVNCIVRNIAVLEVANIRSGSSAPRTFFVDEMALADKILENGTEDGEQNKILRGVTGR